MGISKPTKKQMDTAVKYADLVYKFITTGFGDLVVPDKYNGYVKTMRDVLVAARGCLYPPN